jgi:hypothetical protein
MFEDVRDRKAALLPGAQHGSHDGGRPAADEWESTTCGPSSSPRDGAALSYQDGGLLTPLHSIASPFIARG